MPESIKDFQQAFGRYLRDPTNTQLPLGVPARGAKIYEGLLFNNVSGFINACFPVSRSLVDKDTWTGLLRGFFRDWRCQTPYFHGIPCEFLRFLQDSDQLNSLPPWFFELAHYEWIELYVDTLDERASLEPSSVSSILYVNATAKSLAYHWPVYLICKDYLPDKECNTFLVVYRTANHKVKFTEVNAATSLLITIVQEKPLTRMQLFSRLAAPLNFSNAESLAGFGNEIVDGLIKQEILIETGE